MPPSVNPAPKVSLVKPLWFRYSIITEFSQPIDCQYSAEFKHDGKYRVETFISYDGADANRRVEIYVEYSNSLKYVEERFKFYADSYCDTVIIATDATTGEIVSTLNNYGGNLEFYFDALPNDKKNYDKLEKFQVGETYYWADVEGGVDIIRKAKVIKRTDKFVTLKVDNNAPVRYRFFINTTLNWCGENIPFEFIIGYFKRQKFTLHPGRTLDSLSPEYKTPPVNPAPAPENVSTPSPVDNLIKFQPGQFYWNINGYNENQTPDYIVVLSRVGNTVTVQRVSQDGICKDKPFRYRVKISKFGDSFCECVNTFFGYFHSNHLISPNSDKEYIAMTPADIIPVIDDVTFYKVIANAAIIQTACFGFLVLYRSLFLHINMLPFCIETPDYTITIGNSPDELDPSDAVSPELLYALISVFAQFPPPSIFIQWFFLTMKIFPESQDLINARQEKENSEFWKRANLESRAMQRLEQRKQDKLDAE